MSNHTPGPWHAGEQPTANRVYDLNHLTVAHVFESHRVESEIHANARLIAAAPELLAACKAALPHLADLVARSCHEARELGGLFADRIAHDLVEAAIQKAQAVRS